MSMSDFDVVVLGGGSAGYAAARTAAGAGLRVAVVEGGSEVGGLCILRGCMPSKTLLASATRMQIVKRAHQLGVRIHGEARFDPQFVKARKEALIGEFASHRQQQLESGKFTFLRGKARFVSPYEVAVEQSNSSPQRIRSRYFVIATGSVINWPEVSGLNQHGVMTSDDLLATAEVPPSAIVLGGGPVALEAAYYWNAAGCRVTLVQRSPHILKTVDADLSSALQEALQNQGIQIHTHTQLRRVEREESLWSVWFQKNGAQTCVTGAALLNALGRRPAVDELALENAGTGLLDQGRVVVDEYQRCNAPHIFAAGDVCGPHEIVHVAIEQAEVAARNIARLARGDDEPLEKWSPKPLVFAVFTEPQLAVAGASEKELKQQGLPFESASYPFADHGKAMVLGETEGFVKLLAHKQTGVLLGGGAVGPQASELIHEIVVALRCSMTAQELARTPHYHPTLSEIWTYPAEELAERCA